jgi:hypothetical protein
VAGDVDHIIGAGIVLAVAVRIDDQEIVARQVAAIGMHDVGPERMQLVERRRADAVVPDVAEALDREGEIELVRARRKVGDRVVRRARRLRDAGIGENVRAAGDGEGAVMFRRAVEGQRVGPRQRARRHAHRHAGGKVAVVQGQLVAVAVVQPQRLDIGELRRAEAEAAAVVAVQLQGRVARAAPEAVAGIEPGAELEEDVVELRYAVIDERVRCAERGGVDAKVAPVCSLGEPATVNL